MKIAICGSIDFTHEMKNLSNNLTKNKHEVEIPKTSQRIIDNEFTLEDFKKEKTKNGDLKFRQINGGSIKLYYNKIKQSDAILVANITKNNTENYIGANTFLEIAFAHVLDKKIYLLNPLPKLNLSDELKEMNIVILNGDLSKVE